MDNYSASGTINAVTAAPGDTALGVIASALTRAKIYLITLACAGTPADNMVQWLIRTFTAVGTGTPVTPTPLDLGAPASQLSARQNYTAEPTFALTLFDWPIHQRNSYTWNAAPSKELTVPATANAGIGATPIHAVYVGAATATMHWVE